VPAFLPEIRALTFDCFGTLVDWETGILKALRPLLTVRGIRVDDARLLSLYAHAEAALEAPPFRPYREVLEGALATLASELSFDLAFQERSRLADTLPRWPLFHDAQGTLAFLGARFPLVVCSNVDDDLFEPVDERLGSPFTYHVTATLCRSYKPDPRHLRVALALLGLEPHQVLHVAQSRYHDLAPARALGMRTCWINRPSARPDLGLVPDAAPAPEADLTCRDLASLAAAFTLHAPPA
jgi:2-haloacid dehalogenase